MIVAPCAPRTVMGNDLSSALLLTVVAMLHPQLPLPMYVPAASERVAPGRSAKTTDARWTDGLAAKSHGLTHLAAPVPGNLTVERD